MSIGCWLVRLLIHSFVDVGLIHCWLGWLIGWLVWCVDWFWWIGLLWLVDWLAVLVGSLAGLVDWSHDWWIDCLDCLWVAELVCWVVSRVFACYVLVVWLVGWLSGWLLCQYTKIADLQCFCPGCVWLVAWLVCLAGLVGLVVVLALWCLCCFGWFGLFHVTRIWCPGFLGG